MTPRRFLLGAATVLTALLMQETVLTRLPLPGVAPDLMLVLVVAFALAEGPLSGLVTGFVGGLLADASADHALGRLALAYAVVGYLAGLVEDDRDRSVLRPALVVGLGALGAVLLYAAEGVLLGDPRVTLAAFSRSAVSSVPYAVVLTPLVVPVVAALCHRVDSGRIRR